MYESLAKQSYRASLAYFSLLFFLSSSAQAQEARPIQLTQIDDHTIGYATFQSHNQKIVHNDNGIFAAYLKFSKNNYMAQTWRLVQSTDGGQTFKTIFEETRATNPPVLETDPDNNIYVGLPDFADGNAYLYRFPADDYTAPPQITTMKNGSAGKYAMARDLPRKQLFFFSHNNTFHSVGLDGQVRSNITLLKRGENGALQYPHLTLADNGTLYAAWTTQRHGKYLYWDVHAIRSPDSGASWQTLAGSPLELPIIADEKGPADRISGDDEFEYHTWLSASAAKDGKLHLVYWAQSDTPVQHYVRYDMATGKRDVDHPSLSFGTEPSMPSTSGLLAWDHNIPNSPLYFAATTENRNRVACLVSHDNGETWQDFALSEKTPKGRIYSIGGCRDLTPEGDILGVFTDLTELSKTNQEAGSGQVYMYRIKTR